MSVSGQAAAEPGALQSWEYSATGGGARSGSRVEALELQRRRVEEWLRRDQVATSQSLLPTCECNSCTCTQNLELTVVILRSEIRVSVFEPDVSDLTTADTYVLAVGGCADLSPCARFAYQNI